MSFRTIEWRDNKVIMIDQTRLPAEEVYNEYTDFTGVAEAIRGTAARFDLFASIQHHEFPGGPMLRTPLLVLAMAWYRLRDLMG